MKEFTNLLSGINYFSCCPSCQQKLSINRRYYHQHNDKSYVRFNLIGNDYLTICLQTQEMSVKLRQSASEFGYFNYGLNYQSIRLDCQNPDCGLFSYALQLEIDLNQKIIKSICLSSESISKEDELGNLIEIENVYCQKFTQFTHHMNNCIKKCQIPLIPINFYNLSETFDKVKKLSAFY